eukprot:UN25089
MLEFFKRYNSSISFLRKKEEYNASQRILGVVRLNSVRRLLLSCIQFVTFSYYLSQRFRFSTRLQ